MKVLMLYLMAFAILGTERSYAEGTNLLQEGFAAVAVSTESIEAICVKAISNDYAQLGADWDADGLNIEAMFAGMEVICEPKIVFITEDSFKGVSEIAFENTRPKNFVRLSMSDVAEINEALIVSQIKSREVDPKTFNIDLERK